MAGRDNLNEGHLGGSLTDGTNPAPSDPIYSIPKNLRLLKQKEVD